MSDVLSNPTVLVVLGAVIGVALSAIGAVVVLKVNQAKGRLFQERQGYPGEGVIEPTIKPYVEALWPFAVKAVVAVFKASQRARDELEGELSDLDKKALADRMYEMLPDAIFVGSKLVPTGLVKTVIGREQWQAIVQNAFDSLLATYRQYSDTIDRWVEDMLPPVEASETKGD